MHPYRVPAVRKVTGLRVTRRMRLYVRVMRHLAWLYWFAIAVVMHSRRFD